MGWRTVPQPALGPAQTSANRAQEPTWRAGRRPGSGRPHRRGEAEDVAGAVVATGTPNCSEFHIDGSLQSQPTCRMSWLPARPVRSGRHGGPSDARQGHHGYQGPSSARPRPTSTRVRSPPSPSGRSPETRAAGGGDGRPRSRTAGTGSARAAGLSRDLQAPEPAGAAPLGDGGPTAAADRPRREIP